MVGCWHLTSITDLCNKRTVFQDGSSITKWGIGIAEVISDLETSRYEAGFRAYLINVSRLIIRTSLRKAGHHANRATQIHGNHILAKRQLCVEPDYGHVS